MALTPEQQTVFRNDVLADATLNTLPPGSDSAFEIARVYNLPATPDFWVWKTALHEHEITGQTSPDGTVWSWVSYIARSPNEQNGWARMFNSSLTINPSLPNVRQGVADIFSGNQNNAPAQRAHLLAISRRKASRVEKLLASGTGSTASPATMTHEGALGWSEVKDAMGW